MEAKTKTIMETKPIKNEHYLVQASYRESLKHWREGRIKGCKSKASADAHAAFFKSQGCTDITITPCDKPRG